MARWENTRLFVLNQDPEMFSGPALPLSQKLQHV